MRRTLAAVLCIVLLAGCRSAKSRQAILAPNFALKDLSGNTVKLDSFRGHPVLLDFWATWCGPCQISIPLVQKFYLKHKDAGLVVLGMNIDEEPSPVFPFVKRFHMTYPVLFAGASSAPEDFRVEGVPTFIFLDTQGHIVDGFEGFSPDMPDAWEADFQRLSESH
jgi:cytochrome c biogenesis protein CcmG, thiol:disulfide interchange protein DsbE